jgi:hypothetical protein
MTIAIITFTAKLDLNSPLLAENMTDEEKLQGWIFAARLEPQLAMQCLTFDITGELEHSNIDHFDIRVSEEAKIISSIPKTYQIKCLDGKTIKHLDSELILPENE